LPKTSSMGILNWLINYRKFSNQITETISPKIQHYKKTVKQNISNREEKDRNYFLLLENVENQEKEESNKKF